MKFKKTYYSDQRHHSYEYLKESTQAMIHFLTNPFSGDAEDQGERYCGFVRATSEGGGREQKNYGKQMLYKVMWNQQNWKRKENSQTRSEDKSNGWSRWKL